MSTMMDRSQGGYVVWCTKCPSWRDHFSTEINAVDARCSHEKLVHKNLNGPGHIKRKRMRRKERELSVSDCTEK